MTSTVAARRGSSPLARGLLCCCSHGLGLVRIIPARAGFTFGVHGKRLARTDHPRSRGVYNKDYLCYLIYMGSSPLARGLRVRVIHLGNKVGIIPARAGFTLADPWNPNDEPHYQTSFAFTADLALAPQSSDSVVVSQRSTRTPSEA